MESKVFNNFKKWWDKNQYKSYKNQDIYSTGEKECNVIYSNKSIGGRRKNELSDALLEMLIESFKYDGKDEEIKEFLERFPLIDYYFIFIEKIKILIKEDIVTKKEMFFSGKYYVENYEDTEIIKLGLTLLRFAECNEALEILKIFSNHNEFIFYAIEGIKEYSKCNSIIFDIAKGSNGYGKVIAVSNLEVLNEEIRNWIIEKGLINDFLESLLIALTFNEYYYLNYFLEGRKTKKKYEIFTRNMKCLLYDKENLQEYISVELIEGYFEYYKVFPKKYENLYVIFNLVTTLFDDDEYSIIDLEATEDEIFVRDMIIDELLQGDYEQMIKDEISYGEYDKRDALLMATMFNINLDFDDFKETLNLEPLNLSIYSYILNNDEVLYKKDLFKFVYDKIPFEKIASGPENITEEDFDEEYIDDASFHLMIDNMYDCTKEFLDYNIKGLKARYIPTRQAAFNNLKGISEQLGDELIEYINEAYTLEVDDKLKRSMKRFLDSKNESKNRIIIDIDECFVNISPRDLFLIKTNIAGTKYNDLTTVEDKLIKDKIVFLKREKDNLYDKNAIMVLNDDGYLLGYIPRKDNEILKNIIDNGKHIYGIITEVSEDFSYIEINLKLSYEDVMEEVSATINMVTEDSLGYLN